MAFLSPSHNPALLCLELFMVEVEADIGLFVKLQSNCCELILTSSKTTCVNKQAYLSSQVQICVTEYRQLITTCTCANLSE